MQVVQSVENAGFWISRDALSAQEALADGHSLVLDWEDWAGNIYQVSYDLVNGNLQRSAYIEFWENGVLIDTSNSLSTIARSIDENTNYTFEDGKLTCSITSTIGPTSENRVYQINLRPEQPFS